MKRVFEEGRIPMGKLIARAGTKALVLAAFLALSVPAMRAQGNAESLYKGRCAGCHAADGSGSTAAGKAMGVHDFRSPEVQKMTDAELTEIIAKGKNKMPKYEGKLKDSEIKDLVAYVKELSHKK
jgi:cytochrome c6